MTRERDALKPSFDAPVAVAPHPGAWRGADVLEIVSLLTAAGVALSALMAAF